MTRFHALLKYRLGGLILIIVLLTGTWSVALAEASTAGSPELVTVQIPETEKQLLDLIDEVKALIEQYHTKDVASETLYEGALRGMLEALADPYSQYLDKDQFEKLNTSLEGEYSGIGVTVGLIDGNITVVGVFKGSPAEAAGVKAGDVLVKAGGEDLLGKVPQDASRVLRGEAGTTVDLMVRRPSTGETLTFLIARERIVQPTLDLQDLGNGLYCLSIYQFTSDTARQFPVIMKYLKYRGLNGLVLDLRGNPGGLLDAAVAIASELVPKGPVVELRRKGLKETIENHSDIDPVPVAVLVDGGTASASEIVAGAIKDRGVGVIVGERTFGKACVQSIIPLGGDMGGIRLTIADYYTPAGRSLAGTGLTPDFPVKAPTVEPPDAIVFKRTLGSGAVGLDVLAVQDVLDFLGYPVGEMDGVFGDNTNEALAGFCRDRGMEWSGAVDQALVSSMNAAAKEAAKNAPDVPLELAKSLLESRVRTGRWQ